MSDLTSFSTELGGKCSHGRVNGWFCTTEELPILLFPKQFLWSPQLFMLENGLTEQILPSSSTNELNCPSSLLLGLAGMKNLLCQAVIYPRASVPVRLRNPGEIRIFRARKFTSASKFSVTLGTWWTYQPGRTYMTTCQHSSCWARISCRCSATLPSRI